jgi:hypothetical protein
MDVAEAGYPDARLMVVGGITATHATSTGVFLGGFQGVTDVFAGEIMNQAAFLGVDGRMSNPLSGNFDHPPWMLQPPALCPNGTLVVGLFGTYVFNWGGWAFSRMNTIGVVCGRVKAVRV